MVGGVLLYAKRGAFAASATFLITFIASMAAINYYELVERALTSLYEPLGEYADALGLFISFLAVFLLLQYIAVTFLEENIEMNIVANTIGGAVFGGLASLMLAGLLAMTWLMLPGSAYFLGGDTKAPKVAFGADELLLRTARYIANDRVPGSKPFDPTHSFMKTRTNKYRGRAEPAAVKTTGRETRRTGISEDVNLKRGEETEE